MTQTDERLVRLETKMDAVMAQGDSIAIKLDGKLSSIELDVAKLKLQVRWLAGALGILAIGSGSAVGILRLIGGA